MEVRNGTKNDADLQSMVSRRGRDVFDRFYGLGNSRLFGVPLSSFLPLPARVMAGDKTLLTRDDIMRGMNVFQRNGLMEYGSIYGHGAYLGPDFTAEYLHMTSEFLAKRYQGAPVSGGFPLGSGCRGAPRKYL